MILLASTTLSQPPLTNLILSLIFGVGQVIVGAGMAVYTARKRRWQELRWFGLAVLGAWIACSGITELIVSGSELLARQSTTLSSAQAAQIRAVADQAFLIASIILLLLFAAFPLLARPGKGQRVQRATNTPGKDASPGE
jgi:uncharacterized membrane protein HdeD (DUF308 family)